MYKLWYQYNGWLVVWYEDMSLPTLLHRTESWMCQEKHKLLRWFGEVKRTGWGRDPKPNLGRMSEEAGEDQGSGRGQPRAWQKGEAWWWCKGALAVFSSPAISWLSLALHFAQCCSFPKERGWWGCGYNKKRHARIKDVAKLQLPASFSVAYADCHCGLATAGGHTVPLPTHSWVSENQLGLFGVKTFLSR